MSALSLDAATLSRVRKVWRLYAYGPTEGERSAGRARLEEMAADFGMDFDGFIAACGLDMAPRAAVASLTLKPRVRVKAAGRRLPS